MVKQYSNVEDYKFKSFTDADAEADKVTLFEFKPLLSSSHAIAKNEFQKVIREERAHAKNSQFKVNPIVEKYRGLKDQEEQEYQVAVEKEVVRGIAEIQELPEKTWLISGGESDIRPLIFRFAVANGLTILTLNKQESSLENVFLEITR